MAKKNLPQAENTTVATPVNPTSPSDPFASSEQFVQKNRNLILIVAGVLVLAVAGLLGFNFYKNNQDVEAQSLLFPSVFQFEADSLKKALNGDGVNDGLTAISEEYAVTEAANLARFYAGVAHLKEKRFDEAIESLDAFKSSDLLVQARAYSLIGDAYMEKNQADEAITYYKKAANYKPNKFFTPLYLMKLALAQEKQKEYEAAIESYDEVIEKYFDSSEVVNAKKYKSRLEGLAAN